MEYRRRGGGVERGCRRAGLGLSRILEILFLLEKIIEPMVSNFVPKTADKVHPALKWKKQTSYFKF